LFIFQHVGVNFNHNKFDELSAMWPYTRMVLIFYSTPAVFFCDATMYIYEDSTALEPHYC